MDENERAASTATREYIAVLTLEERAELVTELATWATHRHPVGIPLFDKAWAMVRAERAHRRPEDCTIARMVVGQFIEPLYELKHDDAAPPSRT